MDQEIQFCKTPDGVQLAYAVIGRGTPIVRTGNWLTHLDYDLKSPVWRHVVLGLAHQHRLLRYDARGIGLSQRGIDELSFSRWVEDIHTVTDAAGFERFVLLGISQGVSTAIAYAAAHPERVSHLILYGGYARGPMRRGDPKASENLELSCEMIRKGWGTESEAYRMFFSAQFMPGATAEQYHALNELEFIAASPVMAERFLRVVAEIEVTSLLPKIIIPTLVLHCKDDARAPFSESQLIASQISGAKLVSLDGKNHLFLAQDPANRQFFNAVSAFLGEDRIKGPLPGTETMGQRLDNALLKVERSWVTKAIVVFAAIAGVFLFGLELWRILHH